MKNLSIQRFLIVLTTGLLLAACNGGQHYDLSLAIVEPTDHDPFQSLEKIIFTVTNRLDEKDVEEFTYEPRTGFANMEVALADLNYYPEFVLTMEGYDAENERVSFGRTADITTQSFSTEGDSFAVYFSNADALSSPPLELLYARAGVKLVSPNNYDVLIVGGADKDEDGNEKDTVPQVESFTPPIYDMGLLKEGESSYFLGQGLVGHEVIVVDVDSVLVLGGYETEAGEQSWQTKPVLISSVESSLERTITVNGAFSPRIGHRMAGLYDQEKILICGGQDNEGNSLNSCDWFRIDTDTYANGFSMQTARSGHSMTATYADLYTSLGILIYGGNTQGKVSAEWIGSTDSKTSPIEGAPEETRVNHAAAFLSDRRVLIAGGLLNGTASSSGVVFYTDCATSGDCAAFAEIEDLFAIPRYGHTLTPLSATELLACGGRGADDLALDSCELITVGSKADIHSTRSLTMSRARAELDALRLPDGAVLLIGGFNETEGALKSVEIYRPGY